MKSLKIRVPANPDKFAAKTIETPYGVGATTHGLELQCPRCGGDVPGFVCRDCGSHLRTIQDVIHAMPPERVAHHARFVEACERTHRAQFASRTTDDFYLDLPYVSDCSRGGTDWSSRASSFDYLLRRVLKHAVPWDARVLDLGAGNCWLSYRLALAGYRPCAVDLLTNDQNGLGAAEHYRNYVPEFFPRIRAELAHLPFRDNQFHAAIFNASLHYTEDFEAALCEALRCCKPNGILVICDTPIHWSAENGGCTEIHRLSNSFETGGSDSSLIANQNHLTDYSLRALEDRLMIRWTVHSPQAGMRWTFRRLAARLRNGPQLAEFPLYVARRPHR